MKKLITYTSIAFFATIALAISAPDKELLMTKEKAAWQSFKDKKSDEFKKLLSAEFMGVFSTGILNLQGEMDVMKTMDIKSFSLGDITVTSPDADTAILTYTCALDVTSNGKDMSGNYNCGSIWRKEKGEWRAIFHSDMKEEAAAK